MNSTTLDEALNQARARAFDALGELERRALAIAREEGAAIEREACAKVADDGLSSDEIRARGGAKPADAGRCRGCGVVFARAEGHLCARVDACSAVRAGSEAKRSAYNEPPMGHIRSMDLGDLGPVFALLNDRYRGQFYPGEPLAPVLLRLLATK